MRSDEQLVECLRQSADADAAEELVRRHARRVHALAYQMILDWADAEDVTQEVFVKVFSSLKGFHGRSSFTTWLYRIAVNTIHGRLARRARTRTVALSAGDDRLDDGCAPDTLLLHGELDGQVERALATLSPKLRAAIVLTTIHDVGVREAAGMEGCSTATMYWRVHEARKQLRRLLAGYLNER